MTPRLFPASISPPAIFPTCPRLPLSPGFLWPEERAFMHEFVRVHKDGFAWEDSERGSFRTDFFPPVDFPVIPHTAWANRTCPIPPGIFDEVSALGAKKIGAAMDELSNSS